MEGNGVIKDFPGNYTDYRNYLKEQRSLQNQTQETAKPNQQPASKRESQQRPAKLTYKEKKEFEALTAEIDSLTAEKNELEQLFNSGAEINDVAAKAARYSELKEILDEKEMRWLELSEKVWLRIIKVRIKEISYIIR